MMMILLLLSLGVVHEIHAVNTATLTTHSDNTGTHTISYDGGNTWELLGIETNWQTPFTNDISRVSPYTKIRVSVSDAGGIGGFIATILYNGQQYSTTNPLGNGHWKLLSASDGDTALVYREKTASPWRISTSEIASDAFWVWNQGTRNTLVFEFDFGSVYTSADVVSAASVMQDIPSNDGTGAQHNTATVTRHKFPKYWTDSMYSNLEQSPNDDSWFESHDGTDGDYVFVLSTSTAWTLVAALCVVGIVVLTVILCRGRSEKRRYRAVDVFGSDTEPITDVEAAKLNVDEV